MANNNLAARKEEIEMLVVKSQEGNHEAFAELYDIFVDPIYRYIYYRVNSVDAEDLVETLFLKVWENIHKYKADKKKSFSAWIFRIAHNLVVDYYRASKDKQSFELLDTIPDVKREHNPIKTVEITLDNEVLKRAISNLKKGYQEIILHKFINEFSNEEVARILKKSEGSIRILQHRALKALKYEFEVLGVKYHF